MQNETNDYAKYGLSRLVTVVLVVAYAYLCFVGLEYWCYGLSCLETLSQRWLYSIMVLCLVIGCVFIALLWNLTLCMVNSKATRNHTEGIRREVASAIAVFALLAVSSVFFTKSFQLWDSQHKGEFSRCVDSTKRYVSHIDSAYNDYAEMRVANVPAVYKQSLSRRLLLSPSGALDSLSQQRQEWLMSLSERNVWNVFTPANMCQLRLAREHWVENYREISKNIYECEPEGIEPFSDPESEAAMQDFLSTYSHLHMPDPRGAMACLLCFVLIMLHYLTTRRPRTRIKYN